MYRKNILIILSVVFLLSCKQKTTINLTEIFTNNLNILSNGLLKLQDIDTNSSTYGAFYCEKCNDYHSRASEAVLPMAMSYMQSNDEKYLKAAILTADWLINQQQPNGSWFETPSTWTGTTTDQLLSLASAYIILEPNLSGKQKVKWQKAISKAGIWLTENMNHNFASINYCATSTATLMIANSVVANKLFVKKAKDLALLVSSKFDEDYFLTGEGNRIRGTKYGTDFGYSLDMSLWGLGIYAKLAKDKFVEEIVKKAIKSHMYFIYPDGSTDGSWSVRSSKWTTYGSVTADGCQVLFSLYADDNPAYRKAAELNLSYLMKNIHNGLLTYGPHYSTMFNEPPCIYPTFCRAKNLSLALLFGDKIDGTTNKIPTQETNWMKYFPTIDLTLVRTKNIMSTVTAYRYKDIRRGADFKYMHRPSGGSITNLWIEDYGYLQASSQTEYFQWEDHYPDVKNTLPLTPRIEFTDSNAYYTNLYEFDSKMQSVKDDNSFITSTTGELKDRNRWEGGVAYILKHTFTSNSIEKNIKLRYHGQKPTIKIVEPFIQNSNTHFEKVSDTQVNILGGKKEFSFKILKGNYNIVLGDREENYNQPFPSLKGYPITLIVEPDSSFISEIKYKIEIL